MAKALSAVTIASDPLTWMVASVAVFVVVLYFTNVYKVAEVRT